MRWSSRQLALSPSGQAPVHDARGLKRPEGRTVSPAQSLDRRPCSLVDGDEQPH
jgi:hypothetical protein